jgi:hypothetical protein
MQRIAQVGEEVSDLEESESEDLVENVMGESSIKMMLES